MDRIEARGVGGVWLPESNSSACARPPSYMYIEFAFVKSRASW